MSKVVFGFVVVAILVAGFISSLSTNDNSELQFSGEAVKVITNCQRLPPTVAVSPTSRTGTPGSTNYYQITVTNNNIGLSCGTSQFNLFDLNNHVGWTTSLFPNTLNLCSSGTCNVSANSYYSVISPTNAQLGTYDFYVFAYESVQTAAGVVRADYVI